MNQMSVESLGDELKVLAEEVKSCVQLNKNMASNHRGKLGKAMELNFQTLLK